MVACLALPGLFGLPGMACLAWPARLPGLLGLPGLVGLLPCWRLPGMRGLPCLPCLSGAAWPALPACLGACLPGLICLRCLITDQAPAELRQAERSEAPTARSEAPTARSAVPRKARSPPKAAGAGGAPELREGFKRKLEVTQ